MSRFGKHYGPGDTVPDWKLDPPDDYEDRSYDESEREFLDWVDWQISTEPADPRDDEYRCKECGQSVSDIHLPDCPAEGWLRVIDGGGV